MPSSHIAKRPYGGVHSQTQSTITSFFSSTPASSSPSSTGSSSSPLSPLLPATVQANLISVGMRVRKSVPEGYKTGGYSAFALFSDCHAPAQQTKTRSPPSRSTHARSELMPFCGILKVGGMAQQVVDDSVPEENDLPFLSSQGSTISDVSVASAPAGKRRFDDSDEEDEEVDVLQEAKIWQDDEVSPRSRPRARLGLGDRRLAVPTSRKKPVGRKGMSGAGGQENMVMDIDFEEADFLDFESWKGDEVDMSEV
ncbi:MAG: hypothetical protein M1818_001559 [Claussenomyces sp. TS43310]|nr:MAG: hypothetical protein M1818_001559 [Claussenomyces sp. TS43310]